MRSYCTGETRAEVATRSRRQPAPEALSPETSLPSPGKNSRRRGQQARPFRRRHPQCGRRLSRGAGGDGAWSSERLRCQCARALHSDGTDRKTEAIGLSELRHASRRASAYGDLLWTKRSWSGASAYAESKLCDVLLAFVVARRWKDVKANALEPGWVATKMGGPSAPDDLHEGCVTQAWLATSEDEFARSSGGYFYHQRLRAPNPIAADLRTQEELLTECGRISGIPLD